MGGSVPPDGMTDRGQVGIGLILVAAVVVVGGVAAVSSYEQVSEGHQGVVKKYGAVTGVTFGAGPHWTNPISQSVQPVEIRPRTYTMSDQAGEGKKQSRKDAVVVQTVNGTTVRVDVTIRYRVDKKNASEFVSQWNTVEQVEQRLIRPTVRSQLRDEAAAIPTSEIYTSAGRQRLAQAARKALAREVTDEALVLEAVQVREVNLPNDYENALTQKEIAKQQVKKQKYKLQKAKKKKQRKRVQAEAEAAQIRIKGQAIRNNPAVLKLRYIEALKYNDNTVYIPTNSNMTLTREVAKPANGNATASGGS